MTDSSIYRTFLEDAGAGAAAPPPIRYDAGDRIWRVLELYQAEGCPHSTRVREKLTDLGASYAIHNPRRPGDAGGDVLNEQVRDELVAVGGEDQIPFLVDHARGETLYEAEEIVDYLDAHYGR